MSSWKSSNLYSSASSASSSTTKRVPPSAKSSKTTREFSSSSSWTSASPTSSPASTSSTSKDLSSFAKDWATPTAPRPISWADWQQFNPYKFSQFFSSSSSPTSPAISTTALESSSNLYSPWSCAHTWAQGSAFCFQLFSLMQELWWL